VKISIREVGDAKVVEVDGDVDLGTSPDLRRTLFENLPRTAKLALNLAAIRYIDSSGIATLIEVLKQARTLQKDFVLFAMATAVHDVLKLTNLLGVFRAFDTEEHALEGQ